MGASHRSEPDDPTPEQRLSRAQWSLEYFEKERDKYQRHMDTTAAEIAELEKQMLDQQRADVTVEIQPLTVEGEAN
jgi:hypothetical protein